MGFLHSCKWLAHPRRFIKMCNVHVYYIRPKDHHLQPRKPSTNTCHFGVLVTKRIVITKKISIRKETLCSRWSTTYTYLYVKVSCYPFRVVFRIFVWSHHDILWGSDFDHRNYFIFLSWIIYWRQQFMDVLVKKIFLSSQTIFKNVFLICEHNDISNLMVTLTLIYRNNIYFTYLYQLNCFLLTYIVSKCCHLMHEYPKLVLTSKI